jgi:CHASE3 domain sensor protein
MMIMTGWAMIINLQTDFSSSNWLLFVIGLATLILEILFSYSLIIALNSNTRQTLHSHEHQQNMAEAAHL